MHCRLLNHPIADFEANAMSGGKETLLALDVNDVRLAKSETPPS
jgi:hypothetical protein